MHVVHIPKNHLMLIAGLVWCTAGAMVCMIGLPMEFGLAPSHLILFPLAVVIFVVFTFSSSPGSSGSTPVESARGRRTGSPSGTSSTPRPGW